jgi:hypothetical protein
MSVQHQLPGRRSGWSEAKAIDQVVHAHFEDLEQVLPGHPRHASSFLEVIPELPLEDPVDTPSLLLLSKLQAVWSYAKTPVPPVLTGGIGPALDRAFLRGAPVALEEELLSLSTTEPTNWSSISRHVSLNLRLVPVTSLVPCPTSGRSRVLSAPNK